MTPALLFALVAAADGSPAVWPADVQRAVARAGANRPQIEKALADAPAAHRVGVAFLVANMPDADLTSLSAAYLLKNTALAYKARAAVPWGRSIPDDVFLNDVLPYANVDEQRDDWRAEFYDLCLPLVKGCKTPTEAALKLNAELFPKLNLKYSTGRRAANQGPKESVARGTASCTGLSIVLADACRAVGVPARLAGTPLWANKRGNHTWVEIWDAGWHFTGACEPDPAGLDRGWFAGDAAQAKKDVPEHAIYAASFRRTDTHFPLVWARRNTSVPAENVTDRYAKPAPAADAARLLVRVTDAKGRVAVPVAVADAADAKVRFDGTSRGETADRNDLLGFAVRPGREYVVRVGTAEQKVTAPPAGKELVVEVALPVGPDAGKSAAAVAALKAALGDKPGVPAGLADKAFASVPLTKADAAAARELLVNAHAAAVRADRAAEVKARELTDGDKKMPFAYTVFGDRPAGGRSLWISMHGGGNTSKRANDRQWENQKKLYTLTEGVYLAPRAPTNTWNLWHEPHIDRLFGRLIEDMTAFEGVNPDRVYLLGYSAGGDGVYQLAPRMADRWAAAAMMAGHPNNVSLLSVRNVPFALQVGANDAAYNRNAVAREYGDKLAELRKNDPGGYEHLVKIHDGKPHWMGGDDKLALPWMATFTRNPVPDRVVWKQTGTPHDRSYWLAVPPGKGKVGTLVSARRSGQAIEVTAAEGVSRLLVRLDDRMLDPDRPVTVTHAGKTLYAGTPSRTVGALVRTLAGRGDPGLVFDAEVAVDLPTGG